MSFESTPEKIRLKKCIVNNFETVNCFQIKNKYYNKEKYIELKQDSIKSSSFDEIKLRQLKQKYNILIDKNKHPDKFEYYKVNISILDKILGDEGKQKDNNINYKNDTKINYKNPIEEIDKHNKISPDFTLSNNTTKRKEKKKIKRIYLKNYI